MSIGFMIFLPFLFWVFIVILIVAVSNSGRSRRNARARQGGVSSGQRARGYRQSLPSVRLSGDRPKMKEGLFDIKLNNRDKKEKKEFSFGSLGKFGNSAYDSYDAKGRKKDFVTGYDKKFAGNSYNVRRAANMQYSHTYDGHEPWDDCLPKEKDPWDKDFYV